MHAENFSSASYWLFADAAAAARDPIARTPSRTPARIARMWTIGGPQGMTVEEAKQALGIKTGPEDLVIYSQYKTNEPGSLVPQLISCQPYRQ